MMITHQYFWQQGPQRIVAP